MNLWFSEVHDAHVPRPEDADPELVQKKGGYPQSMDTFRRTLKGFDRDMGRLMKSLHDMDLDDNTVIVFTGDNGPNPLYDTQSRARAGGLRGQKWSLYEGGVREPFFVRWPGHVPAGKVNASTVVASVDLFPSLCKLAGVSTPDELKADGEDMSDAWLGAEVKRTKPLHWEYARNATYLRPKLPNDRSPNVAIRDGNWKLLVQDDGTGVELYDLSADSKESSNVAAQNPDVAARLQASALAWRKSLPKIQP